MSIICPHGSFYYYFDIEIVSQVQHSVNFSLAYLCNPYTYVARSVPSLSQTTLFIKSYEPHYYYSTDNLKSPLLVAVVLFCEYEKFASTTLCKSDWTTHLVRWGYFAKNDNRPIIKLLSRLRRFLLHQLAKFGNSS